MRRGALAVVACFLIGACRDRPAPTEPLNPASTVTGTWTGALSDLQSLELRLVQDSTGRVAGSGVLWLGEIRIPLTITGRVTGTSISLVLADSLGQGIGGPDTFAGRVSATSMTGTFTTGPFRVPVTFRRTASGSVSSSRAPARHRQASARLMSGVSVTTTSQCLCAKSIRPSGMTRV